MGIRERRQKHKDEFKAEILGAALTLFAEEGYSNFSMRKLATRIEHSSTTIYNYFRDKDDLLFHISENHHAHLLENMEKIRKNGNIPEDTLREVFLDYIRYSLANPEQYKVVFFSNPQLYGRPEEFKNRDTMSLRTWRGICEVIDECMKSGVFRPMDCETLSLVIWSAIHGLVASLLFTKDFPMPDPEVMANLLLDGLFKGFG